MPTCTPSPAAGATSIKRAKRSRRLHRYLTYDELHRLANDSGRHGLLVLLLGYCGLRWGEAIELRVRDLDLLRRRITVERSAVEVAGAIHEGTTKTDQIRGVPIPRSLVEPIARQCTGSGAPPGSCRCAYTTCATRPLRSRSRQART